MMPELHGLFFRSPGNEPIAATGAQPLVQAATPAGGQQVVQAQLAAAEQDERQEHRDEQ
jgi:hypothetical protein